jgi:hypothetical protein
MKTQRLATRPARNLKAALVSIAVAMLLVVGLFMASVVLPPSAAAPVHVLNAPSVHAGHAYSSIGVSGTLAAVTALFPEIALDYLPLVLR